MYTAAKAAKNHKIHRKKQKGTLNNQLKTSAGKSASYWVKREAKDKTDLKVF